MATTRVLDRIERDSLDPLLVEQLGFTFARGNYYRVLESKIVQMVMVHQLKSKTRFRLLLGIDSLVISGQVDPDRLGAYWIQYVGFDAISDRSYEWRCADAGQARESFLQIRETLNGRLGPWLERYSSQMSFAEVLGEEYDLLKGKLYLSEGAGERARACFQSYRQRLAAMPEDDDVRQAMAEVDRLLSLSA